MEFQIKKIGILSLLVLAFASNALWAASFSSVIRPPKWHLQLGAMATNLEQRFDVPPAYASKVSQIRGLVGVQRNIFLSRRWHLVPEFFTLVPWRSGADATTMVFTSQFATRFVFHVFPWLRMNLGPGIFWESYLSQSDAVPLSNGTGTSTFYTPSSWRQVLLFSAQGSLELCFSSNVCLSTGLVAPDPFDALKRRFHGVIKLGIAL